MSSDRQHFDHLLNILTIVNSSRAKVGENEIEELVFRAARFGYKNPYTYTKSGKLELELKRKIIFNDSMPKWTKWLALR